MIFLKTYVSKDYSIAGLIAKINADEMELEAEFIQLIERPEIGYSVIFKKKEKKSSTELSRIIEKLTKGK